MTVWYHERNKKMKENVYVDNMFNGSNNHNKIT